ncbi:hypothetical protein [Streptomyces sp. NPDC003667]
MFDISDQARDFERDRRVEALPRQWVERRAVRRVGRRVERSEGNEAIAWWMDQGDKQAVGEDQVVLRAGAGLPLPLGTAPLTKL